jgi:hypothetical protein
MWTDEALAEVVRMDLRDALERLAYDVDTVDNAVVEWLLDHQAPRRLTVYALLLACLPPRSQAPHLDQRAIDALVTALRTALVRRDAVADTPLPDELGDVTVTLSGITLRTLLQVLPACDLRRAALRPLRLTLRALRPRDSAWLGALGLQWLDGQPRRLRGSRALAGQPLLVVGLSQLVVVRVMARVEYATPIPDCLYARSQEEP